jgi:ribosomal protein S18 acetylase RimI-like enzyme
VPCRLELSDDPVAFRAAITALLDEHEAENSMLAAVLARMPAPRPAGSLLLRVVEGERTVFAAIRHETALIVTRGPDAAVDAAVAALAEREAEVPGVLGPAAQAERFALGWAKQRGCRPVLLFAQRMYELRAVIAPAPGSVRTSGRMRALAPEDLDVVAPWGVAFDVEALAAHELRTLDQVRTRFAERIADGKLFGWEVEGSLVSMAGLTRPTARTISVNSVYTPPALRRRGFASALVAAVSAVGLAGGKEVCVLYTDLANPTANAIYQKIGYRPLCDSRHYRF